MQLDADMQNTKKIQKKYTTHQIKRMIQSQFMGGSNFVQAATY